MEDKEVIPYIIGTACMIIIILCVYWIGHDDGIKSIAKNCTAEVGFVVDGNAYICKEK